MNRELLMKARSVVAAVPEAQVDLSDWVSRNVTDPDQVQPSCGTHACIAGWIAGSKQIPGLSLYLIKPKQEPAILVPWRTGRPIPTFEKGHVGYRHILGHLAAIFDISTREAEALFSCGGDGEFDGEIRREYDDRRDVDADDDDDFLSDKALALARFDYMLDADYVERD